MIQSLLTKETPEIIRFFRNIDSLSEMLDKQASIMLSVKNGECFADKINDTFEGAIDDCVEALEKQLVKFKEKIRAK